MPPNILFHDPRPEYIRALIRQAGLTQNQAARACGVCERTMRYYCGRGKPSAPYAVQYLLEQLAAKDAA